MFYPNMVHVRVVNLPEHDLKTKSKGEHLVYGPTLYTINRLSSG